MSQEAYNAFNRLAYKFNQAVGESGPATEAEAAQMMAQYLDLLADRFSEAELGKALDEFRAGQTRMQKVMTSLDLWQKSGEGQQKEREFKQLVKDLYAKMSHAVL